MTFKKPDYTYTNERAAKRALREVRAMFPFHTFGACNWGFSGWQVYLYRDGQACAPVTKLKPLPFTVAAGGTCVVFRAKGVSPDRHHIYPTHRRALNKLHAIRGLHVEPIEFVGPLQEHVQRRVKYLASAAR